MKGRDQRQGQDQPPASEEPKAPRAVAAAQPGTPMESPGADRVGQTEHQQREGDRAIQGPADPAALRLARCAMGQSGRAGHQRQKGEGAQAKHWGMMNEERVWKTRATANRAHMPVPTSPRNRRA